MIDIDSLQGIQRPLRPSRRRRLARARWRGWSASRCSRGGELVARYGGEEFALLLPGADLDDTRRAAERCAQIVADAKIEHRASATSAWLTISIGVASQVAVAGTDGATLVEIGRCGALSRQALRPGADRVLACRRAPPNWAKTAPRVSSAARGGLWTLRGRRPFSPAATSREPAPPLLLPALRRAPAGRSARRMHQPAAAA